MPSDAISQSVAIQGIESFRPCLMGTRHMAVARHYSDADFLPWHGVCPLAAHVSLCVVRPTTVRKCSGSLRFCNSR